MSGRWNVRYGDGAIETVPRLVSGGRVLLVCGRKSFAASGAARILPELSRVAEVERWSGFAPNPDAADLLGGLRLAARFRPDLVLGVGGGSAMDAAKLLCAFAGITSEEELRAAIRDNRTGVRGSRLALAPTTSGSGSEATHFAIVYIGEEKFSVTDPALLPDVTILDPALAASGSPYQRATSGIDAVAQAIESMWAVSATGSSRRWARHALRLLLPALERYVAEPVPGCARAMAIGSHLAGRAIDTSRTTAAHALSYAITKRYGVSHGHAVALTLGAFIEAHATAGPDRLQTDPDTHQAAMAGVLAALGARTGARARERFTGLLERIGLEPRLSAAGSGTAGPRTAADRRALAATVNTDRLANNPVRFDRPEIARLLAMS